MAFKLDSQASRAKTMGNNIMKNKNRTKKLKKSEVVYNGFIPNKMATKRRR
jgi:hypothetical protein